MRPSPASKKTSKSHRQPRHATAPRSNGGEPKPLSSLELTRALDHWQDSLRSVKGSIDEATRAIATLRSTLSEMAPLWDSLSGLEQALKSIHWDAGPMAPPWRPVEEHAAPGPPPDEPAAPPSPPRAAPPPRAAVASKQPSRSREEPADRPEPAAEESAETDGDGASKGETGAASAFSQRRRPLPTGKGGGESQASHAYTVTVEDPGSETPLVPLYRALARVGRIRDMDLVSYTNGVAVIAVQSDDAIASDDLSAAIAEALERQCRVVSQDDGSFIVRLSPR